MNVEMIEGSNNLLLFFACVVESLVRLEPSDVFGMKTYLTVSVSWFERPPSCSAHASHWVKNVEIRL